MKKMINLLFYYKNKIIRYKNYQYSLISYININYIQNF